MTHTQSWGSLLLTSSIVGKRGQDSNVSLVMQDAFKHGGIGLVWMLLGRSSLLSLQFPIKIKMDKLNNTCGVSAEVQ